MGTSGYKKLTDERKENFKKLKEEMTKLAEKYGERILEVKNNPISIGMSCKHKLILNKYRIYKIVIEHHKTCNIYSHSYL